MTHYCGNWMNLAHAPNLFKKIRFEILWEPNFEKAS